MSLDPEKNLPSAAAALALVHDDLLLVEKRIAEVIRARESKLTEISDYLINAGGKRIRPAVSLLVFRACGGQDVTDMVDLCVALELIHTATLLHDDIIDSNDVRRGKPAAPAQFGMADTLVTGDFLFSRAFQVCGRFEECIVDWAAQACVGLTEGEILQGRYRRNPQANEEIYIEIIRRKTASLFEAGARIAAHLAGLDTQQTADMAKCGDEIGLAFQIIDDLLDIVGDAARTGKRVGTDLADGNPSLPIVWGMQMPKVNEAFLNEGASDDLIAAAIQELQDAGIPRRVHELAVGHANAAAAQVERLPAGPHRDGLLDLINDLVDRDL